MGKQIKVRKADRNHAHVVEKDIAKKALKAAKELEKMPMPSREEIAAIYKDAMEEAKKLQKLLKPEWFVKDVDEPGKKKKKI
jgi:hypothetical protein